MAVVLGFGSTEREVEQAEGERVTSFLRERLARNADGWFTDEIVSDLKAMLSQRKKELDDLDAKYRHATDYPERYSTFYFNVLNDITDLVVVFKFSHINRRHPMSPDGWALWQNTYPHYVSRWELAEVR